MARTWTNTATTKQKITTNIISEIQGAVDTLWYRRGTGTTGGTSGTTINLSPNEASGNYDVIITLNENPGGDVGHLWVTPADKGSTSFKVYNEGVSGKSFTWILLRQPS